MVVIISLARDVCGSFHVYQKGARLDNNDSNHDRLKTQLDEVGLTSYPRGPGIHSVLFSGLLRPWMVDVRESSGWICLRAHVMTLPKPEQARNALLDAVMRANERNSVVKYAVAWTDQLVLDAQYLAQHVNAQTLSRLVWLVKTIADRDYPLLLDVARSADTLSNLEGAYKRSPAA